MKRILSTLIALSLLVFLLAGCAGNANEGATPSADASTTPPVTDSAPPSETPSQQSPEPSPEPSEPAERTITDMAGREVTIPAEIKTIATFGSIGVLNAFVELMGAGSLICNDMSPNFTRNSNWAMQYEFAPQIAGAPVLENADREVLIEDVLALNPDLCITMTKPTAELLADKGLAAVYFAWTEPEDVKVAVELMGEILGAEALAAEYISYFDGIVAKAETLTAGLGEADKMKAIYGNVVDFSQPHKISEWWISTAGGISVTKELHTEESLTYTAEDLLLWNPDIMFLTADQAQQLKENTQLAGIAAVQSDAIYVVPTVAHTWGNRTVEQPLTILWALNKMYPELYTEQELAEDISYFYSHFFLYDMSDEQIAKIIG